MQSRLLAACLAVATAASGACDAERSAPAGSGTQHPILLFDGAGTSPHDVAAVETLLAREHLAYSTVSSDGLNAMSVSRLRSYRLLIVPGGDFVAMGDGLTPSTLTHVRDAVRGGLGYLGICAGAFLAGHFPAPYHGVDLTSGIQFHFYSAEARGLRKTAVRVTTPVGAALDQYWEDGPQLSGWGDAVGRFPDGTPAIVQGTSGRGWVVLSGVHPEAPATWREGLVFGTPADVDNAYAITLIRAALDRVPLPTF